MAFPIIALIASILGKKQDKPEAYRMGTIGESVQPGMRRTWDNESMGYSNTGSSTGEVQPGQQRYFNQGTGGYQGPQGEQRPGGGFNNFANKAQTIGSILGTLNNIGGNQNKRVPYQMQINRRY